MKPGRRTTFVFACFVALLVLISAYCTDRDGGVDEPGFLNPPYMLVHYGHLTFPTFPHNMFFDVPVMTHPPVHLLWVGLLWRLGLTMYYAEATPTVLLLLLSIAIILYSSFPAPVKLGWLFSIGFLAVSGETLTLCFGTRPEGEIQAAWFCGLLLLESGRIENWDRVRMGFGAFFLTWASGTHYYAGLAAVGIAVYLIWAVRALGWKEAKPRLIAMCAGCGLFAVPYFGLYVIPYFREIRSTIRITVGQGGGVGQSVQKHFDLYRRWSQEPYHPTLIRDAMALRVPLLVFSAAILAAIRSTRGIALAALPLQLGVFFLAWHKMPPYILHESILFAAAFAIGLLVLSHHLLRRWAPKLEIGFAPVAAIVLSVWLAKGVPMLAGVRLSFEPKTHEVELAHAAGQRIMGLHARMGGRWWSWYASGAEHWYDVERDLHLGTLEYDPTRYLGNLDAVNVCSSPDAPGRPNSWYADGTLKLRGFYFAQTNSTLRCVLLSAQPVAALTGYIAVNDRLYRFVQSDQGNYDVLSTVCPPGEPDWNDPTAGVFSTPLLIGDGPEQGKSLYTVVVPRSYRTPTGAGAATCREVSRIRGNVVLDDPHALLESSRRSNPVMHFYRDIEDIPGYSGVGLAPEAVPPPEGVRLENVHFDFSDLYVSKGARVEHVPQMRVTTIPDYAAFAVLIPVKNAASVTNPCWVVLKLRVRSGRAGFCVYDRRAGIVRSRTASIAPSAEPQTLALFVPDFRSTTDIAIFSGGSYVGVVDIFDVAVLGKHAISHK